MRTAAAIIVLSIAVSAGTNIAHADEIFKATLTGDQD